MISSAVIEVTSVVLCGGTGSRLWPLSRVGFPKGVVHRLSNIGSEPLEIIEV